VDSVNIDTGTLMLLVHVARKVGITQHEINQILDLNDKHTDKEKKKHFWSGKFEDGD